MRRCGAACVLCWLRRAGRFTHPGAGAAQTLTVALIGGATTALYLLANTLLAHFLQMFTVTAELSNKDEIFNWMYAAAQRQRHSK